MIKKYIKMFTGIAEGKGVITALEKNDDIVSVEVKHSLNNNDISVNDSICCSGICLTVIKQNSFSFRIEMVPETIKRSTANQWDVGTIINLERAMLPTTRMGGHYLQGHVDTVAQAELGSLHGPKLEPVVLARRTRKYRTFCVTGHDTVILKSVVLVLKVKIEEPKRLLKLSISDH